MLKASVHINKKTLNYLWSIQKMLCSAHVPAYPRGNLCIQVTHNELIVKSRLQGGIDSSIERQSIGCKVALLSGLLGLIVLRIDSSWPLLTNHS